MMKLMTPGVAPTAVVGRSRDLGSLAGRRNHANVVDGGHNRDAEEYRCARPPGCHGAETEILAAAVLVVVLMTPGVTPTAVVGRSRDLRSLPGRW
jgi:hypothetical protein